MRSPIFLVALAIGDLKADVSFTDHIEPVLILFILFLIMDVFEFFKIIKK